MKLRRMKISCLEKKAEMPLLTIRRIIMSFGPSRLTAANIFIERKNQILKSIARTIRAAQ